VIPKACSTWKRRVDKAIGDKRLELIAKRPVVVWFCRTRKAFQRLCKVKASRRDDSWILWGWNEDSGEVLATIDPTSLEVCLRTLQGEDWVPCEFKAEADFHRAVSKYLE